MKTINLNLKKKYLAFKILIAKIQQVNILCLHYCLLICKFKALLFIQITSTKLIVMFCVIVLLEFIAKYHWSYDDESDL